MRPCIDKQTEDQIVNDIRGSYATGFVLFNLNGAHDARAAASSSRCAARRSQRRDFALGHLANCHSAHAMTLYAAERLPESYISDTWLYGNVRNGTTPGMSTMSLTGQFYLRNNAGQDPDRSDHGSSDPQRQRSWTAATIVSPTARSA